MFIVHTSVARFLSSLQGGLATFCRELEVLSRQRHPFILRLLGATVSPPDHCWVITELLHGGTVTEWLHGEKKRTWYRKVPLPALTERLRIALEVALGMQYLHEQKPMVVHRDLKPSNIFLDDGRHAHIADFGYARFLRPSDMYLSGETGTYMYMAPEVVRRDQYNHKCDVYSFGVLLNELVTGVPPYIDKQLTPVQIANGVADGWLRPAVSKSMQSDLLELISSCWSQDPQKRPNFSEAVSVLKAVRERAVYQRLVPRSFTSTGSSGTTTSPTSE
ncbi:hypothetical protein CBR_g48889 [Chara braunii]|uniref:Protein kinase domain-containing protein n=1 Tax=Chara braunii TaxID=69332 RepID=A0A388M3X0_CHABU|nr:hypothetical protein CBR_g48889 [Chara braunii]|eukprot:GBG89182.1 hypothetical protein CBR_g48889 [Chara braunii]